MSDKDYISRQTLLAKIFDLPKPKTDKTYWDGVDDVSDLISRLPSVIECEDCISLADAIEFFKDDDYVVNELKNLVSVMPKPNKWIPVSERLPKNFRFVNCTCHSLVDDREDWVIETCYVPQPKGSPYSDWGNIVMLNDGDCEVIAWMYRDIPEPYKASPTGAERSDKE